MRSTGTARTSCASTSPKVEQAFFSYLPLPDGDIDYRFAVAAMVDAGYDGYLAIEGVRQGDQLTADGKSVQYVKGLLKQLGAAGIGGRNQ